MNYSRNEDLGVAVFFKKNIVQQKILFSEAMLTQRIFSLIATTYPR